MAAQDQQTTPKHGLYLQNAEGYIGDLARPELLVEYAVAADDAGWDGVFMADGLTPSFKSVDPWITLAGVATRTDHVALGTWITPLPRRQPWQVAHDLATLDHLSDGRVIMGAGLGVEGNYTTFGEEWDPGRIGRRYDEALAIVDGLWRGGPFSYEGEFYTLEDAELPLTPLQEPRIPILMGAWWPNERPFQRGAEWDGIMPASPALFGSEGEQGEPITGSPADELREMLTYFRELSDDPGEVLMPYDPPEEPDGYHETCRELGVTWFLTTDLLGDDHEANLQRVREGPPV